MPDNVNKEQRDVWQAKQDLRDERHDNDGGSDQHQDQMRERRDDVRDEKQELREERRDDRG